MVETFGSRIAINESSFSCVNRIQTVKRMSMSEQRMCDLSFLAFENKYLHEIPTKRIVKYFFEANSQPDRISFGTSANDPENGIFEWELKFSIFSDFDENLFLGCSFFGVLITSVLKRAPTKNTGPSRQIFLVTRHSPEPGQILTGFRRGVGHSANIVI